jgi:hypothetical protein
MANKGPSEKTHLRCPCCGSLRPLKSGAYTKGALGGYSLQALRQQFLGPGRGDNGGPIAWSRRGMRPEELLYVGRALATAVASVADALDADQLIAEPPEDVLASLENDEAKALREEWVADAIDEANRRFAIAEEDRKRREIDE